METLNRAIYNNLLDADGRYWDNQELDVLEQYVQSFADRATAYEHLREKGDALVVIALRKLAQVQPELVQRHGAFCKADMTAVLRYAALSMLRDDEVFFKEKVLIWLDTVLLAHRHNAHAVIAYQNLLSAIAANLPESTTKLVRPYLNLVVEIFQSHA
jgi:Phycobilisome protein